MGDMYKAHAKSKDWLNVHVRAGIWLSAVVLHTLVSLSNVEYTLCIPVHSLFTAHCLSEPGRCCL